MKPHLPACLFQALLTIYSAAVVSSTQTLAMVPEGYEQQILTDIRDLFNPFNPDRWGIKVRNDAYIINADIINNGDFRLTGTNLYWGCKIPQAYSLTISDFGKAGSISSGIALSLGGETVFENLKELNVLRNSYTSTDSAFVGGAFYTDICTITGNSKVLFNSNFLETQKSSELQTCGGAICGKAKTSTNTTRLDINNNGTISFINNYVSASSYESLSESYGGAIYESGPIDISNNDRVIFNSNYTNGTHFIYGGAIYAGGKLNISGNRIVEFDKNYVLANPSSMDTLSWGLGGAIYAANLILSENEKILFTANHADSATPYTGGGAIAGNTLNISGNSIVEFDKNYVLANPSSMDTLSRGGAISVGNLILSENEKILFTGNHADSETFSTFGGAICSNSTLNMIDNGIIEFIGNYTDGGESRGGAIKCRNLSITRNDNVVFRGNYETTNNISSRTYRLRSVYAEGSTLCLSADEGNQIIFYDALYANRHNDVSQLCVDFNGGYLENLNDVKCATGDIVFSGAHVEEDLSALKENYTQQELLDSLTTEVYATTNLHGGCMRVEDGAIYLGEGINVVENSNATLRLENGVLNQGSYNVTFNTQTTLDLMGTNRVTAKSLHMENGSSLSFTLGNTNLTSAVLILDGVFTQGGELTINIQGDASYEIDDKYMLISINSGMAPNTWDINKIRLQSGGDDMSRLVWENGVLYYMPFQQESVCWNGEENMIWNNSSKNWVSETYLCRYKDGVEVMFLDAGSGEVTLVGTLAPKSVCVQNSSGHNYTWSGSGKLCGSMALDKSGEGNLTINTANTYSGGTTISSGALHVGNKSALGTGVVKLAGGALEIAASGFTNTITASDYSTLKVASGTTLALSKTIRNTGTLTMSGMFNASGLALTQGATTHVDVNGNTSNSGFAKSGGYSVTLVSGGSIVNIGATVTHSNLPTGLTLTLGSNGVATAGGTVDYSDYLLTGSDTIATSAIHAKHMGATVTQKGGTLTVDDATTVNTTGGTVKLTQAVTLGGSIANAAVTASAGTVTATMSGSTSLTTSGDVTINAANSYTGGTTISGGTVYVGNKLALGTGKVKLVDGSMEVGANSLANSITSSGNSTLKVASGTTLTLSKVISNSGTLTMSGTFNASSLPLFQDGITHVDVNGNMGNSGFTISGVYSVTLVNGGCTINNGVTITHSSLPTGLNLKLATNGEAYTDGTIDYSDYLLTSSDTVTTSAIHAKRTSATVTQNGGALTVDDDAIVYATAGSIILKNAATLNGIISGASITATSGIIAAMMNSDISLIVAGDVYMNGKKTYTGTTTINSGTLTLGHGLKSDVTINGGTLNTGVGLTLSNGQDIRINGGGITGMLTTASGSSITVSQSTASINGSLTLAGGTLNLADNLLSVTGVLKFGSMTTLTVSGSYGYGEHTLISAGSISGSAASLTVTGVSGDWQLKTEGNNLVLSITRAAQDIDFPKNGTWANGQGGYMDGDRVTFTNCGTVTVTGEVSPGSTTVIGSGATTWNGSGSVTGNGRLTKNGSSTLTINTSNSFTGGTDIKQGTVSAGADNALGSGAVTIQKGATLKLNGHNLDQNDVTVTGAATLAAGSGGQVKSLTVSTKGGAQGGNGELLYGESLALSGTLKTGEFTLAKGDIEGGGITVTGAATVEQGYIGSNISGKTLEKAGSKRVELKGANSFSSGVTVSGGQLALLEGGSLTGNVTVKQGGALLTAITVNGDITLENGADMHLRPGTAYKLQRGLASTGGTLHGSLATASGARITLGGAGVTITEDATLSGGAISYNGSATLKVNGTLTLKNNTTATGNWATGSSYTIVQANSISTGGNNLNTFFNLAAESYTLSSTGSSITLKKKENVSKAMLRMAAGTTPAMAAEDGGIIVAGGMPEAQPTETAVAGVADAMVQADWGVVDAERAFGDAVRGSHSNLRALGNGESAVWANAYGSMTRQSSTKGHAGADRDLTGAALGFETMAGEHGAAGIGIGHSWSRVNTFGMSRLKQDTQHAGVYGRARVHAFSNNSLWIEGSATYGKTESRGQLGYSRERWTQNSGSISMRVNDVQQINNDTSLNFFGGLEYLATNNGSIEDVKTGSVQNLRGEIGAGIRHAIGKGVVFAQAALQGDMVRHNPKANLGVSRHGANPGRIGGSISVGGAYSLGEHWSVNASYTFEGAKHNNSHNANVGATFRF